MSANEQVVDASAADVSDAVVGEKRKVDDVVTEGEDDSSKK